MVRLSKKSRFIHDRFQRTINAVKRSNDKDLIAQVDKLAEEVNQFLNPRRAKFFHNKKLRKFKKKIVFKPGQDPKIIARRLNGAKGGNKTAALYSHEQRQAWGSKAGTSTVQKYGRDFFSHIRKNRKNYDATRKHRKRSR